MDSSMLRHGKSVSGPLGPEVLEIVGPATNPCAIPLKSIRRRLNLRHDLSIMFHSDVTI
jgi:hypothetical protein